jgi:hypothetical protein
MRNYKCIGAESFLLLTCFTAQAATWDSWVYSSASDSLITIAPAGDISKGIVKIALDGSKQSTVIESEASNLSPIGISMSEHFIAGLAAKNVLDTSKVEYELKVIASTGSLIQTIDRTLAFTWHPQRDILAILRGVRKPGSEAMQLDGITLLDPSNMKSKHIDIMARDIEWAEFDSRLYIDAFGEVYAFDLDTESLVKTEYHGIYFSPSGAFYCARCPDCDLEIYGKSNNTRMTQNYPFFKLYPGTLFRGWFNDHIIIVSDINDASILINLNNGEMLRADGTVIKARKINETIIIVKQSLEVKSLPLENLQAVTFEQLRTEELQRIRTLVQQQTKDRQERNKR